MSMDGAGTLDESTLVINGSVVDIKQFDSALLANSVVLSCFCSTL